MNRTDAGITSIFDLIHISDKEVAFATDASATGQVLVVNTENQNVHVSSNMDVQGQLTVLGSVVSLSDAAVKTDLVPISDALEKVCSLYGYTYLRTDRGDREIGLIAQDVQNILPEAIKTVIVNDQERLTISYGNLAALFVEAIKEMNTRLECVEHGLQSAVVS